MLSIRNSVAGTALALALLAPLVAAAQISPVLRSVNALERAPLQEQVDALRTQNTQLTNELNELRERVNDIFSAQIAQQKEINGAAANTTNRLDQLEAGASNTAAGLNAVNARIDSSESALGGFKIKFAAHRHGYCKGSATAGAGGTGQMCSPTLTDPPA
jgi:TolA-binding protein